MRPHECGQKTGVVQGMSPRALCAQRDSERPAEHSKVVVLWKNAQESKEGFREEVINCIKCFRSKKMRAEN